MIPFLHKALLTLCLSTSLLNPADNGKFDHVDYYGFRKVDQNTIGELLDLHVGTSCDIDRDALAEKLRELDQVEDAIVIYMSSPSSSIALVGVLEQGAPTLQLREPPSGDFFLPSWVQEANERSHQEVLNGFYKGISGEDDSAGHALSTYAPARALEDDLVHYAIDNLDLVRNTLRYSRSPEERATAARLIAFADNKQSIVADLAYAITDPDSSVRNNAVRALSVLCDWSNRGKKALILDIDPEPLIAMLESIEWTDRNKSAALLDSLTVSRPADLMKGLRAESLPALQEMALWHSYGHALFSIRILARLAGLSEAEITERSQAVNREGYGARERWIAELVEQARE